eukprot:4735553-Prymnesium_polylepis.1
MRAPVMRAANSDCSAAAPVEVGDAGASEIRGCRRRLPLLLAVRAAASCASRLRSHCRSTAG